MRRRSADNCMPRPLDSASYCSFALRRPMSGLSVGACFLRVSYCAFALSNFVLKSMPTRSHSVACSGVSQEPVTFEITGIDVPPEALFRALQAWTQLFGLVSFEVFGQTKGLTERNDSFAADAALAQARYIGLADEA